MKEALVILGVIAIILGLTAVRYRRQIAGVIQIWRSLKSAREQIKKQSGPVNEEPVASGKLVNCAKCGTWVPENKAINLRGGTFYCSSTCLEATTNVG
jgi:hypothetical protein